LLEIHLNGSYKRFR